jgi:uncharacterized membrane protein
VPTGEPLASPTFARVARGAFLLGFALGGFFDGILLHQLLQWHHLLSTVGGRFATLRAQVAADGAFHLLMYALAIAGLWILVRARRDLVAPAANQRLLAAALVGFGTWHVLDGVLSHWILGVHRIRMDVPNPLVWDLLWFFAFGVAVIAAGRWLRRRATRVVASERGDRAAAALVLAALAAGPVAALPPPGASPAPALVVFRASATPDAIADAIAAAGGAIVSFDVHAGLWVVDAPPGANLDALYRGGALLVSRSPLAIGCFAWSRA